MKVLPPRYSTLRAQQFFCAGRRRTRVLRRMLRGEAGAISRFRVSRISLEARGRMGITGRPERKLARLGLTAYANARGR